MEDFNVLGRIAELSKSRGWSRYELAKRSDLPQSSISNMYNRGNVPSIPTLTKICDGFGITLAQFFAINEVIPDLTEEQENLLKIWYMLNPEDKKLAFIYLKGLAKILIS